MKEGRVIGSTSTDVEVLAWTWRAMAEADMPRSATSARLSASTSAQLSVLLLSRSSYPTANASFLYLEAVLM